MKLSLATRIFLGYAVVLVTFGAVSLFSVAEMHRNQQEIHLVSQGYLQLSQQTAAIETFHNNQAKDTDRLAEEKSAETRRALIRLARLYFPPLMAQRIELGRARAAQMRTRGLESEGPFLSELEGRFAELGRRQAAYASEASRVFEGLEVEQPDWPRVTQRVGELKALESSIGRDIRSLHALLENRIRHRVQLAQERERRTGLAILGLSVLAIGVGLVATALSARSLRPVRTLIEGVSRIARGDYSAKLGIKGHDEIATLARAFDAMATSLQQREAQLKAQQEALLRAEQLAAVGRISAQVAHEVRNPLSSIGLNVELLEEALGRAHFGAPEEASEARELLAAVTREVDRLTDVTERYLRMARLPVPSLAAEDLNGVLTEVLHFSGQELERSGVRVERRLAEGLPRALVDEGQLRQVFLNLVRNSREAMPEGGVLTVETRAVAEGVEVRFSDTGVGISEEVRERLFEPFFTTKGNGTGLGLAVSRQILQAHTGSIRCEARPGGGTTFVLSLPGA
jgi:two-component system NtrC family sensor kinase